MLSAKPCWQLWEGECIEHYGPTYFLPEKKLSIALSKILLLTSSPRSFDSLCSTPFRFHPYTISSSFCFFHWISSPSSYDVGCSAFSNKSEAFSYTDSPTSSTTPNHPRDALKANSKSPTQPHPFFFPAYSVTAATSHNTNRSSSYLNVPSSAHSENSPLSFKYTDC